MKRYHFLDPQAKNDYGMISRAYGDEGFNSLDLSLNFDTFSLTNLPGGSDEEKVSYRRTDKGT